MSSLYHCYINVMLSCALLILPTAANALTPSEEEAVAAFFDAYYDTTLTLNGVTGYTVAGAESNARRELRRLCGPGFDVTNVVCDPCKLITRPSGGRAIGETVTTVDCTCSGRCVRSTTSTGAGSEQ